MKQNIEEEKLLKMMADRDIKALEFLYDHYSAALYGFIHTNVHNDDVCEEILKETFFRIWKNFAGFDADKNRFFSWMINICRSVVVERMQSMKLSVQNNNQEGEKNVSGNISLPITSFNPGNIGIDEIKKTLEPEYYKLIDLLFMKGNSQSEVAEKLNIPLGTVKTRSHAAIQKIKKLLLEKSGVRDEHK